MSFTGIRILAPVVAVLSLLASASAQMLFDDREVTIFSLEDVESRRQALIDFVWGAEGFPRDQLPLRMIRDDLSPVEGLAGLDRTDTLVVEMHRGIHSYAHHFIPTTSNGRLVVLHHGHAPSFDDSTAHDDVSYGMRRVLEGLLGDGYSVLAVYMTRKADFKTSVTIIDDGGPLAHEDLFFLPENQPPSGSPMRYLLEPVAVYLNYLSTRSGTDDFPHYRDFSFVGFSGGGWTSTVYSALDPRIGLSISVGGSIPLYLRGGGAIGDVEQTLPEFYSIAGYPDLYVLAAHGDGRKHINVLNRWDTCCFSETHHDLILAGGLSYDESLREYEAKVRNALGILGNKESFRVEIDEPALTHTVTWDAIYDTILPELNHGRRYIAATGSEIVARGSGGRPAVMINGGWIPSRLGEIYGTPALLRGAAGINDMIFRTPGNDLVYVTRPPFLWSRPRTVTDRVVSDPAAASRGPGTFDVVVFRHDYRLYHYGFSDGDFNERLVSEDVRGLGQPIMMASEGRLDVFFRGWDRQLYHASLIGDGEWVVKDIGGRTVDLPAAVRTDDGSIRAYARNAEGRLLEAVLAPNQMQWGEWHPVPGGSAPPLTGSPAAIVRNGAVIVASRDQDGGLALFTFSKGRWNYADLGGSMIGSPTASAAGFYARSPEAELVVLQDLEWISLGGSLD
jgi:YD repeat-containing protein